MPTHVYQPSHTPPKWWDRALVHPLDSTVAVLSGAYGLLALFSVVLPGFTPSNSMGFLPAVLALAVGAFWLGGGVLALLGIFWYGDNVSTGWALERFGWALASSGLLVYAGATVYFYPSSIYSWLTPTLLGAGGMVRLLSVYLIERNTRRVLVDVETPSE